MTIGHDRQPARSAVNPLLVGSSPARAYVQGLPSASTELLRFERSRRGRCRGAGAVCVVPVKCPNGPFTGCQSRLAHSVGRGRIDRPLMGNIAGHLSWERVLTSDARVRGILQGAPAKVPRLRLTRLTVIPDVEVVSKNFQAFPQILKLDDLRTTTL